jgi:hypothetical protein
MMEDNGFATGYAVGRDSTSGGYGNGNGFFGNDWAWIVILLLFGYGGRGFGGFGGGYGAGGGVGENYVLATDFATIERKLDGINNGICDATFQLTNTLNSNFRNVDNAICTLGYQALQNTNAIQTQLSDCCCGIKGEIKDVAYGNERNAWTLSKQISDCCCDLEKMNMQNRFDAQAYNCNTLSAIDKVGDRIIDYLANEKTQALRDENFALRLAASQAKQNEFLIARLGEKCPEPAYIVQPPQQVTFPTNCCGTVNYASNGCGCGSF